jgi:hypothetical protein
LICSHVRRCIFLTLKSSSSSSLYTLSTFFCFYFLFIDIVIILSRLFQFFISLWPCESPLFCSGCDGGCYAVAVVALVSCIGTELDKRMLHFGLEDRSPVVLIACAVALSQVLTIWLWDNCAYCWSTLYSLGDTLKPNVFFCCFSSLVTLSDIELDR